MKRVKQKGKQTDMPATLQITTQLTVTPLLDMHNTAFANHYRDGLWLALSGAYQGDKPFSDRHLVENLKQDAARGYFDGQHEDRLLYVGFYFGAVHGCLLSPQTGQLQPGVTTLLTCTHPDAAKGYYIGRRDCFLEPMPDQRIQTECELLEELRSIALDLSESSSEDDWYYSIGCVLGNLSAHMFPATTEEDQQWEAEHRAWQAQYEQEMAKVREAESAAMITLQEG